MHDLLQLPLLWYLSQDGGEIKKHGAYGDTEGGKRSEAQYEVRGRAKERKHQKKINK